MNDLNQQARIEKAFQIMAGEIVSEPDVDKAAVVLKKAKKGLVKKVIVNKKGHKQTVYVDPNKGEKKPGRRERQMDTGTRVAQQMRENQGNRTRGEVAEELRAKHNKMKEDLQTRQKKEEKDLDAKHTKELMEMYSGPVKDYDGMNMRHAKARKELREKHKKENQELKEKRWKESETAQRAAGNATYSDRLRSSEAGRPKRSAFTSSTSPQAEQDRFKKTMTRNQTADAKRRVIDRASEHFKGKNPKPYQVREYLDDDRSEGQKLDFTQNEVVSVMRRAEGKASLGKKRAKPGSGKESKKSAEQRSTFLDRAKGNGYQDKYKKYLDSGDSPAVAWRKSAGEEKTKLSSWEGDYVSGGKSYILANGSRAMYKSPAMKEDFNKTVVDKVKSGEMSETMAVGALISFGKATKYEKDTGQLDPKRKSVGATTEKKGNAKMPKKVAKKQPTKPKYNRHGKRHTEYEIGGKQLKRGDKVKITVGGKEVEGEFRHVNINDHSPNGYAVVNVDGKLYERSLSKVSAVDSKGSKIASGGMSAHMKAIENIDSQKAAKTLAILQAYTGGTRNNKLASLFTREEAYAIGVNSSAVEKELKERGAKADAGVTKTATKQAVKNLKKLKF